MKRITAITALTLVALLNLASAVPPKKINPPGPAGGPDGPKVKPCGVERRHKPHDYKSHGVLFHCPGVPPV